MKMERKSKYQTRSFKTGDTALIANLSTRDDGTQEKVIEGYFAVFNQETELWPGAYEEISPDAFNETLSEDIRALINHDTTMVLGRNTSGTLELKADARGLWGSIKTNPNDMDAMNLYERVRRGDVTQCSFGFDILKEKTEWRDDGSVKWILEKVKLYEVSVCTFPAYEGTGVQARHDEVKQHQKRQLEQRKKEVKERIKNVKTACVE
nr:MAG TPA: prohead serine protease [Caudoviricetes sp.]